MNLLGWKIGLAALGLVAGVAGESAVKAVVQGRTLGVPARLSRLAEDLGITPAQRAEIRGVAVHAFVESASCNLENLSPEERAGRLFETRREFFAGVEKVLTPDQRAKVRELVEKRRPHAEAAIQDRLEKAAEGLGVTPEQKEQLQAVAAETRAGLERLRTDADMDDPTRLAKGAAEVESARDRVLEILTPDQRARIRKAIEKRIDGALGRMGGI